MIYPGIHNIVVLQNSTWKGVFRLSDSARAVSLDIATSVFTSYCHGLAVNDRVYISPSDSSGTLPCGINLTTAYYVISTGFTTNEFKVSTSLGGSSIAPHGSVSGALTLSKPINLTGYTLDTDIKDLFSNAAVASMTTTPTDLTNGLIELSLSPAVTLGLAAGIYTYDSSLTVPNGERYYWLSGTMTVMTTFSRN